jgi:hypothetical protein
VNLPELRSRIESDRAKLLAESEAVKSEDFDPVGNADVLVRRKEIEEPSFVKIAKKGALDLEPWVLGIDGNQVDGAALKRMRVHKLELLRKVEPREGRV